VTLDIPCRYYRVYTDPDVPCVEKNFHHVERTLPIPLSQSALVLVDIWSTHYIDSWFRRAADVTQTRIVPLLQAARQAGMLVIHGPSPSVAERYAPRTPRLHHPAPSPPPTRFARGYPAGRGGEEWPPREFRGIYRGGEHAAFGRNAEPRLKEALERYVTELDIAEPARPLPGEACVSTGDEMHGILAERRILHLFYAGFATNWCVLYRDYGMLAMSNRGYNLVLIRDATTGVEFHDTVDTLAATEIQIREIETKYAWSTTTDAFVAACGRAQGG
jgi:nicotinamidase-related amidase